MAPHLVKLQILTEHSQVIVDSNANINCIDVILFYGGHSLMCDFCSSILYFYLDVMHKTPSLLEWIMAYVL